MSVTNFPLGISVSGIQQIGSGPLLTTGKVFFVHSGVGRDESGFGVDYSRPFASLRYALGLGVLERSDIVLLMPGHEEDLYSELSVNVPGIMVHSMGNGWDRGRFYLRNVNGYLNVKAQGVVLSNILVLGRATPLHALNYAILVHASDVKVLNCEVGFYPGHDFYLAHGVITSIDSVLYHHSNILVDGFISRGLIGHSGAGFYYPGTNAEVRNCRIDGNFIFGCVSVFSQWAHVDIHDCYLANRGASSYGVYNEPVNPPCTGKVGPNLFIKTFVDGPTITNTVLGPQFHLFDPVYVVNALGEKAMLINWVESTHA